GRQWPINRRVEDRTRALAPCEPEDATPDSHVRIRVRRPQQVVVRAGSADPVRLAPHGRLSRSDTPTLIGLDVRERQDTLPEAELEEEPGWEPQENDWLWEDKTLLAIKRRPVVLREGDGELVERYRREAERILAS